MSDKKSPNDPSTSETTARVGVLEVVQGPSGPAHGVGGEMICDGDAIDIWLKTENDWVSGVYQHTTANGAFETKVALLQTARTGGRPIFLGYRVRRR